MGLFDNMSSLVQVMAWCHTGDNPLPESVSPGGNVSLKRSATYILSYSSFIIHDNYNSFWPELIPGREKLNTLSPRRNGRHFPDGIFKCIFLNENFWISIKFSLKLVPKFRINDMPALVQIMAWHYPGNKPLFEPMIVSLLTRLGN